jgi:hypothetical protein
VLIGPEKDNERKQNVFRSAVAIHVLNERVQVDIFKGIAVALRYAPACHLKSIIFVGGEMERACLQFSQQA